MFEFVNAGGWLMIPILLSSVIAMAIIIERFFSLRANKVIPKNAIEQARKIAATGHAVDTDLEKLAKSSVVGQVLAVGIDSRDAPRHIMKENIEESGRHAVHSLERYLGALGTISAVTPLMGLLGTVIGMIQVFGTITKVGVGNPNDLAGGISQALITTAAGISVAIIALVFHRYFKGKVGNYVVRMEQEAVRLVEIMNNARRPNSQAAGSATQQKNQANPDSIQAAARARMIGQQVKLNNTRE